MGQRPSWDEYGDASRTRPHRARLGGYRLNFSSSPKATARAVLVSFSLSFLRRLGAPKKPLSFRFQFPAAAFCSAFPPPPTTNHQTNPSCFRASSTASSTALICKAAYAAGVGVERGLSTRFSNHHHVSVRRQPRGSFGSNATLANRCCQQPRVSGLLGAYDASAVDKPIYKLRSLTIANQSASQGQCVLR